MRNSTAPIRRLLGVLLCFVAMLPVQAQETPNARQARSIFDHAYDMFYGSEGCSFNYRISILKIYSSEGTGWYKGNKSKSTTRKSIIWDNGDIKYILRKGKGIVEIHDPRVNKNDALLQKFKFDPEEFTYSIARADDCSGKTNENGRYLLVTLRRKPGAKANMKEVRILLEQNSHIPVQLRIKVSFFWANIYFTNFKAGGIDDNLFIFPKKDYPDYKIVDER